MILRKIVLLTLLQYRTVHGFIFSSDENGLTTDSIKIALQRMLLKDVIYWQHYSTGYMTFNQEGKIKRHVRKMKCS